MVRTAIDATIGFRTTRSRNQRDLPCVSHKSPKSASLRGTRPRETVSEQVLSGGEAYTARGDSIPTRRDPQTVLFAGPGVGGPSRREAALQMGAIVGRRREV